MQYYIMIAIATIAVGGQFCFNKLYERRVVKSLKHTLILPVLTATAGCLFFLCLNKFAVGFSVFSLLLASLCATLSFLALLCSVFVVRAGSVGIYTTFMMLGGMLLPSLYGVIFLKESVNAFKIIGFILLISALFLSILPSLRDKRNRPKWIFYVLCFLSFLLNGAFATTIKIHQINDNAVGTYDFSIWMYAIQFVLSGCCFLGYWVVSHFRAKKQAETTTNNAVEDDNTIENDLVENTEKEDKKIVRRRIIDAIWIATGYAVISGVGLLLQLFAAVELPATVLNPFMTGGTIIFGTLFGRIFFKEKISLFMWISLAIMVVGTVMFLF